MLQMSQEVLVPFFLQGSMSSKLFLGAIVFISTWASMGVSQQDGDDARHTLPCLERLLPCQEYLNHEKPPKFCCKVVQTILDEAPRCFCTVFNNPKVVEDLQTTREEALKLPVKCGYKNNLTSWCNTLNNVAKAESSLTAETPASNGLISTAAPSKRLMTGFTGLDVILGAGGVLLFILEV